MIFVTKPFLPQIEMYQKYVSEIWSREYLTNNGPLVVELENKLKSYFDVENILYTSNGTISIQIALKALDLQGQEVITTPFSYVATTSTLVWENCKPVFADICPETFNISPEKIRDKITPKTKAILATHVFGNPCDIDAIQTIADEYNLVVIYDAAHAFGTLYKDKSIMTYGDVSSISFHATKLFHTIEGGAITCSSEKLAQRMSLMRNFGHNGFDVFEGVGINGKNSEFHAAMGLCNYPHIEQILLNRKNNHYLYDNYLSGLNVTKQLIQKGTSQYNFSYYPIVFESEEILLKIKTELEKNKILTRRYFFPSLNTLNYIEDSSCKISEDISKRILCLPLYFGLQQTEIEFICKVISSILNG
jgi:dTDP-4-amino-4,6-dideoxygalactose transaminase